MTAPLALEEIVESGLCIGCGLCESIAPGVRLVMTPEGRERPLADGPVAPEDLRLINAVCPGLRAEGAGEPAPGFEADEIWGNAAAIRLCHAGDPEIRFKGAAGGALTALGLFLLDSRRVETVVHVAARGDRPLRSRRQESRDRGAILAGTGSRYGPAAVLTDICQRLDRGERFAVIAKPCDISALRNLAREDPRVESQIPYMLALVCGGASELSKSTAILDDFGIEEGELALFRYRGHGNPGPLRIETLDGRAFEVGYKEMWAEESGWRLQFRCKICGDAIGEGADLVAADCWPGGAPEGEDEGFNAVAARTPAGLELFEAAVEAGALVLDGALGFRDLDDFQPHQVRKKRAVADRLRALSSSGRPVPAYPGLRLAALARTVNPAERRRTFEGTLLRIEQGRTDEPPARPESE